MMSDSRIEKISEQILRLSRGETGQRIEPSDAGDELDAVIVGLNTLAEELEGRGNKVVNYEKRIEQIMDVVMNYTLFDFSKKADLGESGDELDAIAIGLNTLAEELLYARENEQKHYRHLEEINIFLDNILENIPNMVVVKEAENFTFVRCNKATEQLLGISAEELIGKTDFDLVPESQAKFFRKEDEKTIKSGQITDIPEEPISTHSGRKWLHTKKIPLKDKNGKVNYLLVVSEDITERKRTEIELKQSEERLRLLIANIQDYAIFMIDPKGVVMNWNRGAEKIKGYTAEEIVGKNFELFYPDDQRKIGKPAKNLKQALEDGSYQEENWRIKKDGTLFWADVIITPLYDEKNNLRGFSKITRDITERKEIQEKILNLNKKLEENVHQLESMNAELEAFTYSVSHDLRAPLRAIHGYTKILEEEYISKLDEDAITMMNSVMQNARKMGQLIEDLLALSHLGRKEITKKKTDMNEIVKMVLNEMKATIQEYNTEVILHPLPPANADKGLVLQAVTNLISNAVKYSSKKEKPRVEIGFKEENNKVVYYIKDNGSGFNMQYYDKLFGIFQRLHDASEFEGTGVGLALVKRIILRHNGKIWAESELGKGSTFYFTLS